MIHGETYLLCNMGLCACAYPLGGRLAGLPLPRPSRWMLAAALGGTVDEAEYGADIRLRVSLPAQTAETLRARLTVMS